MQIVVTRSAQKELDRLNSQATLGIAGKAQKLANDPFGQGSQKLAGGRGYRIRFGDYRIIYAVDTKKKTITIIKIGHRRDVYR